MKSLVLVLLHAVLLVCMLHTARAPLFAQDDLDPMADRGPAGAARTVTVIVESSFEPKEGIGLLLSSKGTIEKPALSVTRNPMGQLQVTFQYDASEVTDDTVASALVRSGEGDLAFGLVRNLSLASPDWSELRPCENAVEPPAQIENQIGLLASLVQVRLQRRARVQEKLSSIMSGDSLATLRKLEAGFGYSYAEELGPQLAPAVLFDRLTRIHNAVKSYRTRKGSKAPR